MSMKFTMLEEDVVNFMDKNKIENSEQNNKKTKSNRDKHTQFSGNVKKHKTRRTTHFHKEMSKLCNYVR
jgi:hypothetical protein